MADEKKFTELTEEELNQAFGAKGNTWNAQFNIVNSLGQIVGRYLRSTIIGYYPCPQCGKPMHDLGDPVLHCNSCVETARTGDLCIRGWLGTEDELKAASL